MYNKELPKGWLVLDGFNNQVSGALVEMSGKAGLAGLFSIWLHSPSGLFPHLVSFSI